MDQNWAEADPQFWEYGVAAMALKWIRLAIIAVAENASARIGNSTCTEPSATQIVNLMASQRTMMLKFMAFYWTMAFMTSVIFLFCVLDTAIRPHFANAIQGIMFVYHMMSFVEVVAYVWINLVYGDCLFFLTMQYFGFEGLLCDSFPKWAQFQIVMLLGTFLVILYEILFHFHGLFRTIEKFIQLINAGEVERRQEN